LQIQRLPELGLQIVKNVRIPMADGVRLAADLYLPLSADVASDATRYPCLLEYIPYRKDSQVVRRADFWYAAMPRHGYVMARVDCRGTGASEGTSVDEYTPLEHEDGHAVVEWLAEQPWCDGHVNMIGISYGGFTSVQVAATAPPHLTSIVPIDFTDRRYTDDVHYVGGLARMWLDPAYYGGIMTPFNALPPDPRSFDGDWAALWKLHSDADPWILNWLRHQTEDAYWRNGSVGFTPEAIRCPVFMISGWWDTYSSSALRLAQTLSVPWKLLLGPWDHSRPDDGIPGPQIDWLPQLVRWLDHWCKRDANGIVDEPRVQVYMQRYDKPDARLLTKSGEWRAEEGWPPAGQDELVLHVAEHGRLSELSDDRDGADRFTYDPRVGVTRGLVTGGQPQIQPVDQRADEALGLVYTTEPLDRDVSVLGWPRLALHAESSVTVIAFAAALSEVAPDGTSAMVCKGILNATRRSSLEHPEPVVPGAVMELEVQLQPTGWTFRKGNRIRLSIASADFPDVWPTPEPATNQVHRGPARPTRLVLPTVPRPTLPSPKFPASGRDAGARFDIDPVWDVRDDILSGARTVRIAWHWKPSGGSFESFTNDIEIGVDCRVDPADPAEASVDARTAVKTQFGVFDLEGRQSILIQGTKTHFHVVINFELLVNGARQDARSWIESIPRQLL
jgi:uncharacterized protein